jgi:site-specific DNA-cytosine methylase
MAGSGNTNFQDAEPGKGIRYSEDPAHVIASEGGGRTPRAFLVNGDNGSRDVSIVERGEPSFTIRNGEKTTSRAWLSQGRVVKMTPRALARFQSFSDRYQLSGNNALDCKGIENACPPLLFQRLYESLR